MFPGAHRLCWDSWWWRSCPWLVWLLHSALKRSSGRSCLLSCPRAVVRRQSTSWQLAHSGEEKQQEPLWNQAVYRKYQWIDLVLTTKEPKPVFVLTTSRSLVSRSSSSSASWWSQYCTYTEVSQTEICLHVTSDETKGNTWTTFPFEFPGERTTTHWLVPAPLWPERFFLGSSYYSRWTWEVAGASPLQSQSLCINRRATGCNTETFIGRHKFTCKFSLPLWISTAHLLLYPVFSPKCCPNWAREKLVSSPMCSTPRVSVMEAPSLPPRLRLHGLNKQQCTVRLYSVHMSKF